MFYFTHYKPIFLLNDPQGEFVDALPLYEMLFSMLRHDFLEDTTINMTVFDVALFFHEKEVPVIDDQQTLIHLLRFHIVESIMKFSRFERVKRITLGCQSKSIVAAIMVVNIYCEFLRPILAKLDDESKLIWLKLSDNPAELFNLSWQSIEDYPQKYVKVQTRVIQALRKSLQQEESQFEERISEVISFVDLYSLNERKFFGEKLIF